MERSKQAIKEGKKQREKTDVYIDHRDVPLHYAAVGRCWQTKDKDAEKQTKKQYVQCFTTIKH